METPYGYKEQDLIALAHFITGGGFKDKSLSKGFKSYAQASDKAAGSIRNLYYALAKFSCENAEFTAKYLDGKPIRVEKSETFSLEEEKSLSDKINEYKARGVSVRKATIILAGGDAKKALRFQNKYRTIRKSSQAAEKTGGGVSADKKIVGVKDFLLSRLKRETDLLVERLFASVNKENACLKKEIAALKSENMRLYKELYSKSKGALGYFASSSGAFNAQITRP